MQWCDFYDAFWDWSDSTRRTRISSLEDIGSGDEVVEAVLEIEDPKVKAQLIRKAIKLGAKFTLDDFQNLQDELSDVVYRELAAYTGHSAECPDYNKDNHTWKYFYENCCKQKKALRPDSSFSRHARMRKVITFHLRLLPDHKQAVNRQNPISWARMNCHKVSV